MDAYVKLMMGRAVEGVKEYLEKYIYSPKTFDEYLELFKTQDIIRATLNARSGHGA
jgi:glutaconate CoA-transferase subunit A